MSAILACSSLVLSLFSGAPQIDKVTPEPLPQGASVQIEGSGFIAAGTTVTVGTTDQQVVFSDATHVIFTVLPATPLGAATLTVTAGGESATKAVEVVPPAPRIDSVTPTSLTLGELATVQGASLDTVTQVELDGVECDISEQTAFVLVFRVPFDASLLGESLLSLTSASGADTATLSVVAPPPVIDSIAPNPSPASSLVTVRGTILLLAPEAELGGEVAPIVTAVPNELLVWLPPTLAPGPHDLVVTAGALASDLAGPLFVTPADEKAPVVRAVYPARVAAGASFWVIGDHLDQVTRALPGLTLATCDRHACRIATNGLAAGLPFNAAVDGPHGASVFKAELVDEVAAPVTVTRIEPSPAIRGQSLSIYGANVVAVRSVLLGGQAQTIDFFDAEKVVVTVHEQTPLGSQTLFLASNVGSDPFPVTVLDPLPNADASPESVEPGPDAPPESAPETSGAEVTEPTRKKDDGCGAGGGDGLLWAAVAVLGITSRRAAWRRPGPWRA
ncbi:MAG: IPT/TIG domain-containing protein [Myxococcota bacterium]